MSEARISRVIVAALHEALSDRLPLRLEFYEHYLAPSRLRRGAVGIASFLAAVSFLRAENGQFVTVVDHAGRLAADWTYAELGRVRRTLCTHLPSAVRVRTALRLTARLVRATVRTARARVVRQGRERVILIDGSPFCETRQPVGVAGCGFYAAALDRYGQLLGAPVSGRVRECRARGEAACILVAHPSPGPNGAGWA